MVDSVCRFATQNESFLTESAPSIPGGAAPTIANDPTGCLLSWDTAGGKEDDEPEARPGVVGSEGRL